MREGSPGMAGSAHRRRPNLSLAMLKRGLGSVFLRNVEFAEDATQPMAIRLQASTAAVQAGLACLKILESAEFEQRLAALEAADADRNGHHAP
jgi:hypothetical protein